MREIEIGEVITVGDLASKIDVPVGILITKLMENGVMATINEKIDFDTAEIVLGEFLPDVKLVKKVVTTNTPRECIHELTSEAVSRPPVVAVMGHVDHGKTTLLDSLRGSKVVEDEAGGITQHISAYQIEHKGRKITFLDTPGHEAFAAIREHGARLTDLAIIVVAADDGVKPQTKEAIRFAKKSKVKIMVAINKIDKPGADINRVKKELADAKVMVEEWGGDTVAVEISAKLGTGIDKLLDMVLLVADIENLKADLDCPAEGVIIDAKKQQGKGAVATVLVEHGSLKKGDNFAAGAIYGRVKTLTTTLGKELEEAGPSTPVMITGLSDLPQFGDGFTVFMTEKEARQKAEIYRKGQQEQASSFGHLTSGEIIRMIDRQREQHAVNVIIKADVQGSLISALQAIQGMEHQEVKVAIISSGIGNISENDIKNAAASSAIVYGFNVDIASREKQLAGAQHIAVKLYNVIYELMEDVKNQMSEQLAPEVVEEDIGRLIVKAVFKVTPKELICGGEVTKGKVIPGALARIERQDQVLAIAQVKNIQKDKLDVKTVQQNEVCGVELSTDSKVHLKEGDRLEFFTRTVKERKL